MDENVKGAITRQLRRRGLDVVTVQEDGYEGQPDPLVADRATALGRVIFTQDEDLLAEATQRQETGVPFPGIIYAHQRHVSIGQCVRDLDFLGQAGSPADFENRVYFLPL